MHTNSSKINEAGNCGVYGVCHDNGRDVGRMYRVQRGYRLLGTEFRSHPSLQMAAFIFVIPVNFANGERGGCLFFLEIERDVWEREEGRKKLERDCGNFDG